jgi:hypothetical protein
MGMFDTHFLKVIYTFEINDVERSKRNNAIKSFIPILQVKDKALGWVSTKHCHLPPSQDLPEMGEAFMK